MRGRIEIIPASDDAFPADASARLRLSPFNTLPYARARAAQGAEAWVFVCREAGGAITAAPVGVLRTGRLSAMLEVPSLELPADPGPLWAALREFCEDRGVTELDLDTFASRPAPIPTFDSDEERRDRTEFVVELTDDDPLPAMATNHRRNHRKAERAGIEVAAARDRAAARAHVDLQGASMQRRRARGESVPGAAEVDSLMTWLDAGAGELFQARLDGDVTSSVLVLQSHDVGYYHSAGTSPAGMRNGSSIFLITTIGRRLRERGFVELNLGGARPSNEGLFRFKKGFGGAARELQAVHAEIGPGWKRGARAALGSLRSLLGGDD